MQLLYKLTAKQEAALARLDATSTGIVDGSNVMNIVGVLVGLKPAALIEYSSEVRRNARRLGLHYVRHGKERGLVSYNKKLAKQLRRDIHDTWGKKTVNEPAERRIGRALGYPETAIDYFIQRLASIIADKPLPTVEPPALSDGLHENFIQIILSPNNFEEEIASYVKPLADATKQYAPHTYEIILKED